MSEPTAAAIELVGATARWSEAEERYRKHGTLWYGMMCRSFLLLERMLVSSLQQFIALDPKLSGTALKKSSGGRPFEKLTFGQCLHVAECLHPDINDLILKDLPVDFSPESIFPESDREIWREAVNRRNRIAHDGLGFFDSVDFNAGRLWRNYRIEEPLVDQAHRAWQMNRYLSRSPMILAAIHLSGTPIKIAIEKMDAVERIGSSAERNLALVGNAAVIDINEFHSNIEAPNVE